METEEHEPERPFHQRVVEYFIEEYGAENVETDKYLGEAYRYADVWVEGPLVEFAVEIENDFEAVFKGIGQAELYAAHGSANTVPVVVVPPDHTDEPDVTMLRERGHHIVELAV